MSLQDQWNNTRRIDPTKTEQQHTKLKNIAGLITNLSYREMRELGDMLKNECSVDAGFTNNFPAILLSVADKILAAK